MKQTKLVLVLHNIGITKYQKESQADIGRKLPATKKEIMVVYWRPFQKTITMYLCKYTYLYSICVYVSVTHIMC